MQLGDALPAMKDVEVWVGNEWLRPANADVDHITYREFNPCNKDAFSKETLRILTEENKDSIFGKL
eukprot:UN19340